MKTILRDLYQRLKTETQSWFKLFGLVLGVFVLFVSATNVARQFFNFMLLPVFENSLNGFQEFTNYVIGNTVFLVIEKLFAVLFYAANGIYNALLGINLPSVTIDAPRWLSDLSVISIVLLRAQTQAMEYSTPVSSLTMHADQKSEWDWAVLNARQPLRSMIKMAWWLVLIVYRIKKLLEWPVRSLGFEKAARLIGLFAGGSLLLGIFYFLHDAFSIPATTHLQSIYAKEHRVFFAWTIASLIAAFLASAIFIVWNGLLLQ